MEFIWVITKIKLIFHFLENFMIYFIDQLYMCIYLNYLNIYMGTRY